MCESLSSQFDIGEILGSCLWAGTVFKAGDSLYSSSRAWICLKAASQRKQCMTQAPSCSNSAIMSSLSSKAAGERLQLILSQ